MDVLTDHVLILVQICLLFLIWDQVLMPLHLRLRVIYRALQVIWQVGQKDLRQVKADLRQVIWDQVEWDQTDPLQVTWDQVDLLQVTWDQVDLLQVIWDQVEWDQMDRHLIWLVDQNLGQQPLLLIWDQGQWDPMDLLQAWIWMETECLLHLQVI